MSATEIENDLPLLSVPCYLVYMMIWCICLELSRRYMIAFIILLFVFPIALLIATLTGVFNGSDLFNTVKLFSVIAVAWIGGIARFLRPCLSNKTFQVLAWILYIALVINILEATFTEITLITRESYTTIYICDAITSIIVIICINFPFSVYINKVLYNTYVWSLDTEWCVVYSIWNFTFGFNRTGLKSIILWINAIIVPLLFMIQIRKSLLCLQFWRTEKGEWAPNRTVALAFKKMVEFLPVIHFLPFWNFQLCDKQNMNERDIMFAYILNIASLASGIFLLYFQFRRVLQIEKNEGKLFEANDNATYELSIWQLVIVRIKGTKIVKSHESHLQDHIEEKKKTNEQNQMSAVTAV